MSKKKQNGVQQEVNQVEQIKDEQLGVEIPIDEATEAVSQDQENVNQEGQLETKIAELEAKCADLSDKNLRMMAEFDNYRRRTNKEKLDLLDTAGERIFKDMLPLIDDFERAMQIMENKNQEVQQDNPQYLALAQGMELIYKKFLSFLNQNKVTAITTEGQAFNVDEQEAITTFAAGENKKGMVIDCTQKGYKLGDKVIRFAKVVVGE